jgi:type IV pilus assembly protein PilY1
MALSISMHRVAPLVLAAVLASPASQAEDIDVFSGVGANSDRPNVLLILDSSANWSESLANGKDTSKHCYYKDNGADTGVGPVDQGTKLAIEQCALHNLVDGLKTGADGSALFNVAIMLMNESPNDGGYPRKHFIELTDANKATLKTAIKAFAKNADNGSNADYGQALYETYLYYKGKAPLNGTKGAEWDAAAVTGGKYNSPAGASCGRNYVIVIGNGSPQPSSPEDGVWSLMSAAVDAEFPALPAAERDALKSKIVNAALGKPEESNWSDEMARFLRRVDVSGKEDLQGIITYAVAVIKGNNSDGTFPQLMNSIANQGGGQYFAATDAESLLASLLTIFDQIQAVNSVFASASLPVSVNARGTFLNQVFMGMFRPEADGDPRWRGNLKQYQFALDDLGDLSLVDAKGQPAISASTGFIASTAESFWTTASSFWINEPAGTPASGSDLPDGEVVEKGGAAQRVRSANETGQAARNVLTCIGCAAGTALGQTSATQFAIGNASLTAALLGVTSTERDTLIDWVRGADNKSSDEKGPGSPTTVRPSVHGDILHSRPTVVNYGNGQVVVFYGGNDGQLRAINGNQSGAQFGHGGGDELWSFVPQEVLGGLARLRKNDPAVKLSTTIDPAATPRDYFIDGPIGLHQKLDASGNTEQVMIYVTMRRGGRVLYAFDVTDPVKPVFKWKANHGTVPKLGQTWSEPRVVRVKGHGDPVVVIGGGYDAVAEDALVPGATTMGDGVLVFDALNGTLLREFHAMSVGEGSIARSVAADVTLVDSDFDGIVDRAYAVDIGGKVYRIDFESSVGVGLTPANWTIYQVADVGGSPGLHSKFFFGPDAVVTRDFTALMFGSGDREKPLISNNQDHFFQILDRRKQKGAPSVVAPVVWGDLDPAGEGIDANGGGCYVRLTAGEKVVNASTSIAGFSYFGTNRPSPPDGLSCSANLGIAKAYAMPLFCTAPPKGQVLSGGGLPPSPVAGIVVVKVRNSDGVMVDKQVPFVIGAPNPRGSAIEASRPRPTIDAPRKRRYWFQEVRR